MPLLRLRLVRHFAPLLLGLAACLPAAPEPFQRSWAVQPAPDYRAWWVETEACAGRRGDFDAVRFYAVEPANGYIYLGSQRAHAWWVRRGNRIYLPSDRLDDEQLVRHEMLHAITRELHHPSSDFVQRCHVASRATWADSTLRRDPANPRGV